MPETLYASGYRPDPASAEDVLAFILCDPGVFASSGDADEVAAVAEVMGPAKAEAVRTWLRLNRPPAAVDN